MICPKGTIYSESIMNLLRNIEYIRNHRGHDIYSLTDTDSFVVPQVCCPTLDVCDSDKDNIMVILVLWLKILRML